MTHPQIQKQADDVRARLAKAIPEPRCELDHENAWQLLIATILSAQSTDKKINEVTPKLFARWPGPRELAAADPAEVEIAIKQTGFFRNKTKAIMGASKVVVDRFAGVVPKRIDELVTLPGVARKTANVVIGTAYGIATGIVVDTHVSRVARKLELTITDDPLEIERDLCAVFPKRSWVAISHRLVLHGRYVCQAKKPRCERCPLNEICSAREKAPEIRSWTARAAWERELVASKGASA